MTCAPAVSLTWTVINRHSVTANQRNPSRLLRKRHVPHHHTDWLPISPENHWIPNRPELWLSFTPIKTVQNRARLIRALYTRLDRLTEPLPATT
ncbi:hypothetical protein ACPCSP_34370 [Streptomyces cinereoruber]|uniref:hypothetical protein n=1 Tax=Streptomyces cinereoruber TaxID=67260 RepID=UPI003C2D0F2E